ncbi:hypothetical protein DY000_02055560 [Brassica cretica]|uniref:Uncharacterized protein n=1 Tax=Brassica cretica TaxID=69181 RepID=A0ABQ7ACA7_BRACR|nr:hypothetical protein DY000_02055560 [Brassica cretica]
MTPSLDQWEKDLFFRVAEEVQESAVNNRTIRVARSVRGDVSVMKDVSHIPEIKASDVLNAYKKMCIDWV